MHELQWRASHLTDPNPQPSGWLVVGASQESSELAEVLHSRGHHCLVVNISRDTRGEDWSTDHCDIDGLEQDQWRAVLDHWSNLHDGTAPAGVVWTTGSEQNNDQTLDQRYEYTRLHCGSLIQLLHVLEERQIRRLSRGFQIVTHSGAVIAGADQVDAFAAQFWGLGRGIGAEKPELRCRMIDVDMGAGSGDILADILLSDSPESQFGVRDNQLHVPRLIRSQLPQESASFTVSDQGSYLVTGGLGMLGRAAARWLASRGARHIVLVSRSTPSESARGVIDEIQASGCQICVHQADIGDSRDVQLLMSRFDKDLPTLRGVIHAAGVLDDALLAEQSWERFDAVLTPKIRGAWELHRATQNLDLDFFVLYSSAASVLGSPGQSNYATANAFLDGLAHQRIAVGLPGLSVNWGPWTEGMADDELIVKRMALQGITPLGAEESHQTLERLLQASASQATVLDIDWRRMLMGLGGESPPLLKELASTGTAIPAGDSVLVEKLRGLSQPARRRLLSETVQAELQAVLSTPTPPDPDTPLNQLGFDSLMGVEFSTRLQQLMGADFAIVPTLLFDYPTVNALSDHLLELLADQPETATDEDAAPSPQLREAFEGDGKADAVAIVGMSCRFPGAASVAEFWDNLLNGVDAVREIPEDRWSVEDYYDPVPTPGKMYTREGGFLEDIADFDADFFGIAGQEACWMDPQHRLLLETSWHALEDAGISPQPLQDANVGVFMGIMSQDYNQLHITDEIDVIDSFQGAGLSHSAGVGRLSYLLGFEGPSVAIDTASSSSLVAVSQAAKSLLQKDCNMALAGGVNAILTPGNSLLLSKTKMLSPDGRCKSFSADADGFGRGEGCGVVVLKRLSDAERDGDRILAVIRGSAVCHNGFSGGLTTPSGRAQERVIRDALEDAGLQALDVDYLEAHGTGTEYGDPIEIQAAASVLGKGRSHEEPLLVGSVKPNIGHLEAAGGISGLIKAVLTIQHGVIPRQLHFEQPSPHIPWQRLPIQMVTKNTAWPDRENGEQRVAGVSAFGMSGTNAHVVLSSGPNQPTPTDDATPDHHLLVLSSKRPAALKQLAGRYAQFLDQCSDQQLLDVCFTAGAGRRHFDQRQAFVASSVQQMRAKLQAFASDKTHEAANSLSSPVAAWLFPDATAPAAAATKQLFDCQPVFRETIQQLDEVAQASGAPRLEESLLSSEARTMPPSASFALQMALAKMWLSWGIEPEVAAGFGTGEYAAACVAGVVNPEEGFRLALARDQLMNSTTPDVAPADEALDQFEQLADTLDYFPANRPLLSSIDGQVVPVHRLLGGSYWRQHCNADIAYQQSFQTLAAMDVDLLLEIGLAAYGDQGTPPTGSMNLVTTISTANDGWEAALNAAAKLYELGFSLDFNEIFRAWPHQKVQLPNYVFNRKRYWLTDVAEHVPQNA